MYKMKSGKILNLANAQEIAAGGEGRILEHPKDPNLVVKIYHTPRPATFVQHLDILAGLNEYFVKPGDTLLDNSGNVVGFCMQYVNFNNYWLFNNLFNKGFCNTNGITDDFKIKVLEQLKEAVKFLHAKKIVVGDLNQYNLFVSKNAEILFVDVDSYATPANPHSGVLLEDIRDFTTMAINEQTDSWAFDILAFWTLTFCHPFKWVVPGNKLSLEQRIRQSLSFLSIIPGIKIPPIYQPVSGNIEKQFKEIFAGRRYMVDFAGTVAPVPTVVKQPVFSASVTVRELFTGVLKVNCSRNYVAICQGPEWIMINASINRFTSQVFSLVCDEFYPSQNKEHAYRIGKTLKSSLHEKKFYRPEFYYTGGSLAVIDYATDQEWTIDIENQVGNFDMQCTPVFCKSIIIRDSPIQNFGIKKYLNVPVGNRHRLIEVHKGTKNAFYDSGYFAMEYVERNRTCFVVKSADPHKTAETITLDYLPYFAVKDGMLFIAEDGRIDIYKEGAVIAQLDVSNCSRDSRLYSTAAGILMLENGILYLLNTKN